MKKITLLFLVLMLAIGVSGAYAYNEGMLDDLIGDEEEEDKEPVSSSGNAPIARITPSNPKIQINETISFSGSDSTDADGDQLSFVWSFEGDSNQYEGASIDRNYPDKGEFLVTLVVTDSTGMTDEIETTVSVVEDYHGEVSGDVHEGESDQIEFPVESGVVSVYITWSLDDEAELNPIPSDDDGGSTVNLTLIDADDVVVAEAESPPRITLVSRRLSSLATIPWRKAFILSCFTCF